MTTKKTTSSNFKGAIPPKGFLNKLGEMHTSETELSLALPLIIKAAKSQDLKILLRLHLKETKGHMKSVKAVAKSLNVELPTKGCKRMTVLIAEGVKVIAKRLVSSEQDASIIAVGQKIEQFEIESYRELCATAKDQSYTHELAVLTSILNQEKIASELLGQLAVGKRGIQKLIEKVSLKKAGASSK